MVCGTPDWQYHVAGAQYDFGSGKTQITATVSRDSGSDTLYTVPVGKKAEVVWAYVDAKVEGSVTANHEQGLLDIGVGAAAIRIAAQKTIMSDGTGRGTAVSDHAYFIPPQPKQLAAGTTIILTSSGALGGGGTRSATASVMLYESDA